MIECTFCRIVAGETLAHQIYEDDQVIAFLDIMPVSPGHVLVAPKAHILDLESATDEMLAAIMKAIKKIVPALLAATGTNSFNIEQNNGHAAGQLVPHLHFHLIPRRENDGLEHWPGHSYHAGEAERLVEQIKRSLTPTPVVAPAAVEPTVEPTPQV